MGLGHIVKSPRRTPPQHGLLSGPSMRSVDFVDSRLKIASIRVRKEKFSFYPNSLDFHPGPSAQPMRRDRSMASTSLFQEGVGRRCIAFNPWNDRSDSVSTHGLYLKALRVLPGCWDQLWGWRDNFISSPIFGYAVRHVALFVGVVWGSRRCSYFRDS